MKKDKKIESFTEEERSLTRSVFHSDELLAFLYKKTERLTVAVYMVTNFLNEDEPLRKDLRGKCLNLLDQISQLDGSTGDIAKASTKVLKGFFEIDSSLSVASSSGMISQMNCKILREVTMELVDIIESNFDLRSVSRTILNNNFFSIKDIFNQDGEEEREEVLKDIYKGHYYKRQNVRYNSPKERAVAMSEIKEDLGEDSKRSEKNDTSKQKRGVTPKIKDRQETIIGLVREKGEISASDIAEVITDCSQKTIQRDLAKLVRKGVLRKEGKKRWSRYSLV